MQFCTACGINKITHKGKSCIEALRIELDHLKEREKQCPTMLESEARALLRALQEIAESVGLTAHNSPRETVEAVKALAA